MIFGPSESVKDRFINHPAFENLSVLPYVRGRLVFAELAARAVLGGQFDLVLVDLPSFMNRMIDLSLPARFFPKVSSLVIRNAEGACITIPFVPNDAACIAVAAVQMRNGVGIPQELIYVDDPHIVNYGDSLSFPAARLRDDYLVFVEGLERYFARPFEALSAGWEALPEGDRRFHVYRAGQVAERVATLLKQGRRTLLICEYRLWQLISEILNAGGPPAPPFFFPWRALSAAWVMEDPYAFWVAGLLDDFPAVVKEFYDLTRLWQLSAFDKLAALNRMIGDAASSRKGRASFRKLLAFRPYLQKRHWADGRIIPLPLAHLFDAAASSVGPEFAGALARRLIDYPEPRAEDIIHFLTIHPDAVIADGEAFEIPALLERWRSGFSFSETREDRLNLLDRLRPRLEKKEREELGEPDSSVVWEIVSDYQILQTACAEVRALADRIERGENRRVKKSWGSMGAGIEMKATIASKARGEAALYVKQRRADPAERERLNETTSTVFLLADDLSNDCAEVVYDSNITRRKIDLGNRSLISKEDPPPDFVYSVFVTYRNRIAMCEGHLTQRRLTSITFLYTKHLGVKRYNHITRRPKRFHCRIAPLADPELAGFTLNDLGIAWAVKYADRRVIVVAKDGWKPSAPLSAFARTRGVGIMILPLSRLSSMMIDRMKRFHLISTSLKKHPNSEEILSRFIQ